MVAVIALTIALVWIAVQDRRPTPARFVVSVEPLRRQRGRVLLAVLVVALVVALGVA